MIQITDVSFQYDKDRPGVLDQINLVFQRGEAVVLIGANGSGKSTLARLLAGLTKPKLGRITIGDQPVTDQQVRRSIGILFQNPDNQMVGVTVEKELAFGLENRAVPSGEIGERIDDTLSRFQIGHLRRRLTSELSGGEKQRVALAAVMICRPDLLILDEPDSFLDQQGRTILNQELARLHNEQPDLVELRITQYLDQARAYERVIVLAHGKVCYDDHPIHILDKRERLVECGLAPAADHNAETHFSSKLSLVSTTRTIQRLDLHEVDFAFEPTRPLVRKFSRTFSREERLCVVGPSGSGKSTLALLMTGLLKPQAGSVSHLHADGSRLERPKSGCIVAVFQQPERQFFLGTVWDELRFGPHNIGVPLSDDDAQALLTLVGLEPEAFLKRDPFSLSMGEQRRLSFAVVLAMRPSFIIFDEPTGGLDPLGVAQFIALSRHLTEIGIGQTIITHDGGVVHQLASSVLVMNGGVAEYSPGEFWSRTDLFTLVSPVSVDNLVS